MSTGDAAPLPVVSVLIPARDEVETIARCIEHVAEQSIGAMSIELIVADGASTDGTASVARSAASDAGFRRVVVVDNAQRTRSSGLNLGLGTASTGVVARVDARALVSRTYLETCCRLLDQTGAVCVGGAQVAVPRSDSVRDRAVARALQNRIAMGFSRYRRGAGAGPTDTVWLGVYRRSAVERVGGWPSELDINEDFELNRRLRDAGGVIWFDPAVQTSYLPRNDVVALAKQYWAFGRSKGTWWRIGQPMGRRHAVLLALPVWAAVAIHTGRARFGTKATAVLVGAGLMMVDHLGVVDREPLPVRVLAASLNVMMGAMWWSGALAGLVRPEAETSSSV